MPFDETRVLNQNFVAAITSQDPGLVKYAQEETNNFIRTRLREDAVCRRVLPAEPVTPEDYVPQLEDDEPAILVEMEPRSPGAVVMGLGRLSPPAMVFHTRRFPVRLRILQSSRLRKHIHQLETYRADIRTLLAEMLVKDLGYLEDVEFFRTVNTTLNYPGTRRNIFTNMQQSWDIVGGISRVTLADAHKRTMYPQGRIPVNKAVTNITTLAELQKLERLEVGDDRAADIFFEGWGDRTIFGIDIIATIKREIVPDDHMYMFGDSNFIGKYYVRTEPTMYIKTEELEVDFYCYEILGGAIAWADAIHHFVFVTS